jgi:hypothetical protein
MKFESLSIYKNISIKKIIFKIIFCIYFRTRCQDCQNNSLSIDPHPFVKSTFYQKIPKSAFLELDFQLPSMLGFLVGCTYMKH